MWDLRDMKIIFSSDQSVIECRYPEAKALETKANVVAYLAAKTLSTLNL